MAREKKSSLAKTVALGSAGVAAVAGTIAAGAALADRGTRKTVTKTAKNMSETYLQRVGRQTKKRSGRKKK